MSSKRARPWHISSEELHRELDYPDREQAHVAKAEPLSERQR